MADQYAPIELAIVTSRVRWLLSDLEELAEQFTSKIKELERAIGEDENGINKT